MEDYKKVEDLLEQFDSSKEALGTFWKQAQKKNKTIPKVNLAYQISAVINHKDDPKNEKTYNYIHDFLMDSSPECDFKTYWQSKEDVVDYSNACKRKKYMEYHLGISSERERKGLTAEQYAKTEKLLKEFDPQQESLPVFWQHQKTLDSNLPSYRSAFDIWGVMDRKTKKDKNTYIAIQSFLNSSKSDSNFGNYWASVEANQSQVVSRSSALARKKYMEYQKSVSPLSSEDRSAMFLEEYYQAEKTHPSAFPAYLKKYLDSSKKLMPLDKAYETFQKDYKSKHPQDKNPEFLSVEVLKTLWNL